MAQAIEGDFQKDRLDTVFITTERLKIIYLEAQPIRNEIDYEAKQTIINMRKADLAIVDDLGTDEKDFTEFFKEQFKMFLDEHRGKLIITTNLTKQKMETKLNDKIVSRIFENCRAITLRGKDYRRSK